jgi:hypothetical protein
MFGTKIFYVGLALLLAVPPFFAIDARIGGAVAIIGAILVAIDK